MCGSLVRGQRARDDSCLSSKWAGQAAGEEISRQAAFGDWPCTLPEALQAGWKAAPGNAPTNPIRPTPALPNAYRIQSASSGMPKRGNLLDFRPPPLALALLAPPFAAAEGGACSFTAKLFLVALTLAAGQRGWVACCIQ